jgi:hypothetical protein
MATDPGDSAPPRQADIFRHLQDLRSRTYEGVPDRKGRVEVFRRAVALIDPLVRRVLEETNARFLDHSGEITGHGVDDDGEGGHTARWELSWPAQREATSRSGGHVEPIQVWARFARYFNHPHLGGSKAGNWPLQVTSSQDAARQEPIVRAIIEAELHERIFDGGWPIVPGFAGKR